MTARLFARGAESVGCRRDPRRAPRGGEPILFPAPAQRSRARPRRRNGGIGASPARRMRPRDPRYSGPGRSESRSDGGSIRVPCRAPPPAPIGSGLARGPASVRGSLSVPAILILTSLADGCLVKIGEAGHVGTIGRAGWWARGRSGRDGFVRARRPPTRADFPTDSDPAAQASLTATASPPRR